MARYNSVNTTSSVAGGTSISTPSSGLLTTLTGTGTVTIPNPILYTGQTQTFYNSTGSAITLSTPSGNFTGAGASGNGNLTVPGSSVVTVVSDGANYIVQDWIGGTITVGGTLTANGAVSLNPTGLNVSIQPTGAGVLTLSSGTKGSLDNVDIGTTTAGNAKFGTLESSGITKVTANTVSSSASSGALQVTGGVGIAGALYVGSQSYVVNATNPTTWVSVDTALTTQSLYMQANTTSSDTRIGSYTNHKLGLYTNNTVRVTLDTAGYVGIGTASPTTTLTLKKPIDSAAYGSGTRMIDFQSYFPGYDVDTVKASIYSGVSGIGTLNTQGGYLAFYTSNNGTNAERMRIEKDGTIGVNTTNTNTVTGNYTFNVALRARFNGMMLGNNDGTNASDNRIQLDWSSGSNAYIYAQQNVPLYIGSNNATQLTVSPANTSVASTYFNVGNEFQTVSGSGSSGGSGPYEIFRCNSTNLCTSGFFSISATRNSYVHTSTWAWSSSHNGTGQGTITMLSSTTYSNMTVYLDVDGSGDCWVSADWGAAQGYSFTVVKTSGGTLSVSNNGTNWNTQPGSTGRYSRTTISSGFAANNGKFDGSLSKGSGSFRIDHPLPALTATHQLVHSFIEGPNADLIYRGEVDLVDGRALVDIDQHSRMTDGTFEVLCRKVQCFTTNETDWTAVRGRVIGNILTIEAQDTKSTATVSWMVIGERKDPHMYETEWTDSNGEVVVEPLKNPVRTDSPPYPEHVNTSESKNGTI